MNALIEVINGFSAKWADAMWAVAWQGTLLAFVVAGVCWALRRQSPGLRYWLWLILTAKLLAMPLWAVDVTAPQWLVGSYATPAETAPAVSSSVEIAAATIPAVVAPAHIPERQQSMSTSLAPSPALQVRYELATWQTWAMLGWAFVVIMGIARTAWQLIRLRRVLAGARPVDDAVASFVAQCAKSIGLARPPLTRHIHVDSSPLVCGPLRPVLLLPAAPASRFDPISLRQIVLHELAHLRRRDLQTIWIVHAMRTIYWFHPLVYWIAYRAGLERELACDQLAMAHSGASASAYARTLIHAAGRLSQPMVLSAAGAAHLDGGAGSVGDGQHFAVHSAGEKL